MSHDLAHADAVALLSRRTVTLALAALSTSVLAFAAVLVFFRLVGCAMSLGNIFLERRRRRRILARDMVHAQCQKKPPVLANESPASVTSLRMFGPVSELYAWFE
jgi:hypothetical protein